MNFQEIPQFIQTGSWICRYSLIKFVKEIEDWKNGINTDVKLEMNPDFQRGHVWTEEQQVLFIESLLKGGAKNAKTIHLNHPNWMRTNNKKYNEFVCVDGLQRFTAIKNFLDNNLKVFGLLYKNFSGTLRMMHDMFISINDLPTKKDILRWYIEMNYSGTIHSKEELDRVKTLLAKESLEGKDLIEEEMLENETNN